MRLAIAGYFQPNQWRCTDRKGGNVEAIADRGARDAVKRISRLWWLWIVFGIGWVVIGVVILQFDQASINTVGILVGAMFLVTGFQQFAIMSMVERGRWLYGIFGVLFLDRRRSSR